MNPQLNLCLHLTKLCHFCYWQRSSKYPLCSKKRYAPSKTLYMIPPDMFCTLQTCFPNTMNYCYLLSSLLAVLPLLSSSVYNATIATSRTTLHVILGVQQSIASNGDYFINTERTIRKNVGYSMNKVSLLRSKVLII